MPIQRFHDAQAGRCPLGHRVTFTHALGELQAGRKQGHWIWYILPQLNIFGSSKEAAYYGIANFKEACDYLEDPVLFDHYHQVILVIEAQVKTIRLSTLMGHGDDNKFISSLTLFREAAVFLSQTEAGAPAQVRDLIAHCDAIFLSLIAQGYASDRRTLNHIQPDILQQKQRPPVAVNRAVNRSVPVMPVPVMPHVPRVQPVRPSPMPVVSTPAPEQDNPVQDSQSPHVLHGLASLTMAGGGIACIASGLILGNPILIVIGAVLLAGGALYGATMYGLFSKANQINQAPVILDADLSPA
jgi:uncharacterized protein (DUF1810 family)